MSKNSGIISSTNEVFGVNDFFNKSIDYFLNIFDSFVLKVPADDPDLIRIVRNFWLRWPSKQPYNLDAPEKEDFSMGQSLVVDNLLKQKVRMVKKISVYGCIFGKE